MTAMARQGGAAERGPRPLVEALVHADALHNLARYLTRDPGDAQDLVQETYARALHAWADLEPGSNVKAWLFRILRNAFVSRWRSARREPAHEPYDTTESTFEVQAPEGALAGDVELGRLRRVVGSEIEAALLRLSDDARTAILLDLEGFTESEVAAIAGCAVGTVKSRLSRARAALRSELADYRPGGGS
jgi:RNA polymerase sigma-70 factor, ECF subfamily